MSDIFISYASADRPLARKLSQRLEQEGWSVWWDRKIPPGKSFTKVLEAALKSAKCVVVLWSSASRVSDWVHNEAAEGKQRGILVPAFIEETTPPFEFQRIQGANLVGWEEDLPGSEMDQFIGAIQRVISNHGAPQPSQNDPSPQSGGTPPLHNSSSSAFTGRRFNSSRWLRWSRWLLFTVLIGMIIMGLFKSLFPQTPVTEAITAIAILSMGAGAGMNYCWSLWRRKQTEK